MKQFTPPHLDCSIFDECRTAFITGGNRGIGKAIAKSLAEDGINLIISCRSLSTENREFFDNLKRFGIKIGVINIDLENPESIKEGMKKINELKTIPDILINNAGQASFSSFMFTRLDDVKRIFQVNYFAPLQITQNLIKKILRKPYGRVINIGSVAGIDGSEGNSAYGASKAALMLWTRSLAKELSKTNITVNAIAPGIISTQMSDSIKDNMKTAMVESQALMRSGSAEEVANVVKFLCKKSSQGITGQILRVDGGTEGWCK